MVLRNAGAGVLGDLAFASNLSPNLAFFNSKARGVEGAGPSGFPVTPGLAGNLDGTTWAPYIHRQLVRVLPPVRQFRALDSVLQRVRRDRRRQPGSGRALADWRAGPLVPHARLPIPRSAFRQSPPNDPLANIIANVLANSLNSHNGVPGNLSNYLNDCGAEANAISPSQNPLATI